MTRARLAGGVRRRIALSVAVLVVGLAAALAPAATAPGPPAAAASVTGWTVYHGDALGTGVSGQLTGVNTATRAWTSPALDGEVFGQPLFYDGRVYVATEDDTVYALSAATGAVAWSDHVASPVASSQLPCGNIGPTVGITGTPVIDPSRSEIFVVAAESSGGVHHYLVGLDAGTGRVERTQDVDPPGADPAALLQRSALNLDGASVVFGFGGNYGDCGQYQGRVVSVPEAGGGPGFFTVDAGHREGAVWMGGGAPVVDSAGHIWVTAGNGSQTSAGSAYDDSDSVLELSSSLALMAYFAPSDWAAQNAADADMSTTPALLSDGEVVAAGKAQVAYLLNGGHLGGIGGQQADANVGCGDDVDGGMAYLGTTVFLPCLGGPVAISVGTSPPHLGVLWRSGAGGGPPILAAGRVWSIGRDGVLYGLSPTTGSVEQRASVGSEANHFPTPAVGGAYLLVPTARAVVAFSASTASPPPPAPTTTAAHATTAPAPAPSVGPTAASGPAGSSRPVVAPPGSSAPGSSTSTTPSTSSAGPGDAGNALGAGRSVRARSSSSSPRWWLVLLLALVGGGLLGGGVALVRRRAARGRSS